MKKLFTLLLILVVIHGCNNLEHTSQEHYEFKKAQLKTSITKYNEVARNISLNTANLMDRGQEGYLNQLTGALNVQYPEDHIQQIALSVESKLNEENLSDRLLAKQADLINVVEGSLASFYGNLSNTNLRTLGDEDSIATDSVFAFFEDFKSEIKEGLVQEESNVDHDETLTEEEKLALIAANYNLQESMIRSWMR